MNLLSLILFGPSLLAHAMPASCFAIGGFLIVLQFALFRLRRRRLDAQFFRMAATFGGLLWMIFGFYELQMQAWEATVAAPLRIDLVVLVPILYVLTMAALISLYQQFRGQAGDFRKTDAVQDEEKENGKP